MTTTLPESPEMRRATQRALNLAWIAYLILLVVPFLVFLGLILLLGFGRGDFSAGGGGHEWFIVSTVWIGVTVPIAFWFRSRLFRDYWSGGVVSPGRYLSGMLSIWVALEIGGLLGLIGCFVSKSLMPSILPALVAFMLFTPFWPSGQAMTRAVGSYEDSELFKHPR